MIITKTDFILGNTVFAFPKTYKRKKKQKNLLNAHDAQDESRGVGGYEEKLGERIRQPPSKV